MKQLMYLLIFVLAGVAWALVVTVAAASWSAQPYLSAPWAGIALGTFGGWIIGAAGLRLYTKIAYRSRFPKTVRVAVPAVLSGREERYVPQVSRTALRQVTDKHIVRGY